MICVLCQSEAVDPVLSSDGHICAGHIYRPTVDDPYERVPPPNMRVVNYFDYHGIPRPAPLPMPPLPESAKITVSIAVTKASRMVQSLNAVIDTLPKNDAVVLAEIIHRLNAAITQEVGICVL